MILVVIGIIIILIIVILPAMSGGNPKYTRIPYKVNVIPLNSNLGTVNRVWTNNILPVVILDANSVNITMEKIRSNPDYKKILADIFEPPASLVAPCFYDQKTFNKYKTMLESQKTNFKGFWSFCGHDGGNLSQLHFLMKDYKLVSSAHIHGNKLEYARSAAKFVKNPKEPKGMDKSLDKPLAIVKNVLETNPKDYLRKDKLPGIFAGTGIFADTYDIESFLTNYIEGTWIVKPVNGFGGAGIIVANNQADIKAVNDAEKAKAKEKQDQHIVCKYIANPLLFNGKKMHLRAQFLVGKKMFLDKIINEFSICPIIEIMTASKPYELGNLDDKQIHDSHRSTSDGFNAVNNNYFMVEGSPVKYDIRWQDGEQPSPLPVDESWDNVKVREAVYRVMDIVKSGLDYNKFVKYGDSDNAYRVFASDIMLDTEYNPYLLEINKMPGKMSIMSYRNYNRQILNWEMNAFVFPILKGIKLVGNQLKQGSVALGEFSFTQSEGKTWISISVKQNRMGHGSMLLHRLENERYAELKSCYAKVPKTNKEAIRFFQKYFSLLEKGDEYIFKY